MSGQRRGYAIALVVAVLVLVVSMGAAATLMGTSSPWHWTNATGPGDSEGWRQGLNGGAMMGQGRGGSGMMGDWDEQGAPRITADSAKVAAEAWAATNQPGATVAAGGQMPMGYPFTVTEDGQSVGMIIVNDDTGQVTWLGAAQPSQTPSAS